MPFQIIRDDIARVRADAIVNTANPEPRYASGVDRAIYEAAGAEQLLAARREIGAIKPGETAATPAFALQAKYILHTVGPVWCGGNEGEQAVLAECYLNSLKTAAALGCESIAFPLIATGVYGFPKALALEIALEAIRVFLHSHEMDVTLVVFDRGSYELSGRLADGVRALIDEREIQRRLEREYRRASPRRMYSMRAEMSDDGVDEELCGSIRHSAPCMQVTSTPTVEAPTAACAPTIGAPPTLEQLLQQRTETFQECLFRLIDERGLKDSEVYTRANLDRKHFSKIRCNRDYKPKKKTAVALAMALELDLAQTRELLEKAGWALTPASKFDVVVMFFIQNREYDIPFGVNPVLFEHNLETLGA